ncbi:hypothetical protein HDE79_003461 [Rhodanobacter sp. MP1X3]|jgi:hypothetical protein|nr:hypothetical protein [Rhodanobacter sp. MP1X3]
MEQVINTALDGAFACQPVPDGVTLQSHATLRAIDEFGRDAT